MATTKRMFRRRKLLRLVQLALFKVIYLLTWLLSWAVPQSPGLVVFSCGTGSNYGGNSRYLFEAVRKDGRLRAVWLRPYRRPVVPGSVWRYALKGIWLLLRAEGWVVDNHLYTVFPHVYPGPHRIFQLWHGVGLKRIALGDKRLRARDKCKIVRDTDRYTLLFTTSPLMAAHFAAIFALPHERIAITGYPRNDLLFDDKTVRRSADDIKARTKVDFSKIVLLAPTWDPQNRNAGQLWPFPDFDPIAVGRLLAQHDTILVVKLHWHMRDLLVPSLIKQRIYPYKIIFGDQDVQYALACTDILITDLSSIAYDYLLLDRPIVIAHPNLDAYDRRYGLVEGYRALLPAQPVETFADFERHLAGLLAGDDPDADKRAHALAAFHRYRDDKSSSRCLDAILAQLHHREEA